MWFLAPLFVLGPALTPLAPELDSLVARTAPDSLAAPLARLEARRSRPGVQAQAALLLGQLYYARGEYRPAADAFARASARFDPSRKDEARYWAGLA